MSHFSAITTKLVDRDCLVQGLRSVLAAVGIEQPAIEVHDVAQLLENSYAPNDRAYGNVIVRRHCIPRPGWRDGKAAIDIGFALQSDGTYAAVCDAWDIEDNAIGQHFGGRNPLTAFMGAVATQHNIAYVKAQYPQVDWAYSELVETTDGLQLTLTQKPQVMDLAMAGGI
ncbi:hypothetical protein IQ266_22045 [filamentous cyanobacterium LEGE 11480]|uniref:Uncharacterized protein n=1 Tax=Romeriopsis navalis LEGE 11480 TaxID=2777977 RepID=A0A928VRG4_9CYAN|nr:hypothetical protein [Romeriopsis navalis]MBE9032423.1 hypothetical protein [Romeriopsis navalis LEGE 11480]